MTQADRVIDNKHNMPPSDTELLVGRLEENNNDLIARHDELIKAMVRLPISCDDEETAKKLTSYGVQLKTCLSSLEERRKYEKTPYDQLASSVHNFFKSRIDGLDQVVGKVKTLLKSYNDKQAAIQQAAANEKRRQEEEAARLQREQAQKLLEDAAKLQAEGRNASAEKVLEQAQEVEKQAIQSESIAAAPVKVESIMTRSDSGGSSGSQSRWKAEIVDVKELDIEALREFVDLASWQKALNAKMKVLVKSVKPGDECPQVRGAKIYRDTTVTLRS